MKQLTKLVLSLTFVIGTKQMYAQLPENTINYFARYQISCTIPSHINGDSLTNLDKEAIDAMEDEGETCGEDEPDYCGNYTGLFELDKNTLMFVLLQAGYQVSEQDGFIIFGIEGEEVELAVNLDELILESRSYGEDDNPFFAEAGNKLEFISRICFGRTNDGYIIPEKTTTIEYYILPSGIPYKKTTDMSYLYYEVISKDSTIVKAGDENLFNACMGYTGLKEIQQQTNIKIYPNPTTGQLKVKSQKSKVESIELFDIYGRKLSQFTIHDSPVEIDISHLPAGIYFLKIDGKTVKIIKN
jgi:hypothetical protein